MIKITKVSFILASATAMIATACGNAAQVSSAQVKSAAAQSKSNSPAQAKQQTKKPVPKFLMCGYDPAKGPNPLGMRAYVTLQKTGYSVEATFEQFPHNGDLGKIQYTAGHTRLLQIPGNDMAAARNLIRKNPKLWNELVGFEDDNGFALWEKVVSCSEEPLPSAPTRPQPACAYDPESGVPNPLGMRQFVSIFSEGDDSIIENEHFPSMIAAGKVIVSLSYSVKAQLFGVTPKAAKALLSENALELGRDLQLGEDEEFTKEVAAALSCK